MIKVEEGSLKEVKKARKKYPEEDLNARNKLGQTALNIATRNGSYLIVEYLLKNGADINATNKVIICFIWLIYSEFRQGKHHYLQHVGIIKLTLLNFY